MKFLTVYLVNFILLVPSALQLAGAENYAALEPTNSRVPQNLLSLLHAPEVQHELGIDSSKLAEFEALLRDIDADWWPARNLPSEKQRSTTSRLESKIVSDLEPLLGPKAITRLRQIELQSQSYRCVLRPEIAKSLNLDTKQRKSMESIIDETERLSTLASKAVGDAGKQKALQEAKTGEANKLRAILTQAQQQTLNKWIGDSFDAAKLDRIYPLAPQLLDTNNLVSSGDVNPESLQGNVLLIHFYAFQCHNCVANFQHYKRWHKTLEDRGVRVIGVQTPETSDERDPKKITAAAHQAGFEFPVIMDLKSKNWNAWGNTMWPTVYVVDKRGYIRFWWQGELNWQGATGDKEIEQLVDRLLAEVD